MKCRLDILKKCYQALKPKAGLGVALKTVRLFSFLVWWHCYFKGCHHGISFGFCYIGFYFRNLSFVQANEYVGDMIIPNSDTFGNEYFEKWMLCTALLYRYVLSQVY